MIPDPTERLRFRPMGEGDLDLMAGLLGDPQVMRFYPRPKSRDEALAWIAWNERTYAEHGHGLWILETHEGGFVGDCGLTRQQVEGESLLEVGYHLLPGFWGRGLATEAARACVEAGLESVGEDTVVAIITPANLPSQGVARRTGMTLLREVVYADQPALLFGRRRDPG